MGKTLGTTPLEVMRKQVFPVTYPASLQAEYGTLTLKSPGCEDYMVPVSNRILEDGLVAKMQCEVSTNTPANTRPATAVAPTNTSIKQRLIQIQELYEEGLITKEEYSAKRGAIIDEL